MSSYGKWSTPGVPHKGWRCVDQYDSCEDGSCHDGLHRVCEMCERRLIRYVHVMEHPEYPNRLECGRVCAGKMEEDRAAAKAREDVMKRDAGRRKRSERAEVAKLMLRWTKEGNSWRLFCEVGRATVFPNGGGYDIWMRLDGKESFESLYRSVDRAQKAAVQILAKRILDQRKQQRHELKR